MAGITRYGLEMVGITRYGLYMGGITRYGLEMGGITIYGLEMVDITRYRSRGGYHAMIYTMILSEVLVDYRAECMSRISMINI